jgi:hypothetical protein
VSEHIHTLQEFMLQTKGILYLLAICYFVGFIWFWKFLHGRNRNDD